MLLQHDLPELFRTSKWFGDFVNIFFEKLAEHWSAAPEQLTTVKELFIDSLKQLEGRGPSKQEVDNEENDIADPPQSKDEKPLNASAAEDSVSSRVERFTQELENCDHNSEVDIQRVLLHIRDESELNFEGDVELRTSSEDEGECGAVFAFEPEKHSPKEEPRHRRSKRLVERPTVSKSKRDPEFVIDDDVPEDLDEDDESPKRKLRTSRSEGQSVKRERYTKSDVIYAVDAEGFVECLECQAKFAVEAFFHHMKDTHGIGEVSIQCHDCPKVLTSRKGFSLHQKGNHGPEKQCPVCRKLIPCSAKEYKTHLKIHNMLVCEYCGKEISDSSDHVEQEHGVKAPCPVCNKDIPDRILAGHVKAHSNPKQGCLKCGMHFDTKKDFLLHNRQVHMGRAVDQCNLCDKRFRGLWHLKQHMKESHSEERSEVCKICGESFRRNNVLVNHMKFKHGSKTKCVVCNAPVLDSEFAKHMRGHEEGKQHTCKKCGESFIRATLLKSHITMRHTPKVVCRICGKEVHAVSLSLHLQKHSTVRSKCGQCGAEYKAERYLKVHMKSAHGVGGKKPLFLCQMCGKGFPERYQLKQHQLRHEEPKHQCPDCPRKFFTEQQMQSHSKIHTRGRRFQCKDCLKAFVTEKRLQYHMDTEHLGLRPQACPKCPETFKNFLQMRHHVKVVHEGNGKQRPPKDKKPRKKKVKPSENAAQNVQKVVPNEPGALNESKIVIIPIVSIDLENLNLIT